MDSRTGEPPARRLPSSVLPDPPDPGALRGPGDAPRHPARVGGGGATGAVPKRVAEQVAGKKHAAFSDLPEYFPNPPGAPAPDSSWLTPGLSLMPRRDRLHGGIRVYRFRYAAKAHG